MQGVLPVDSVPFLRVTLGHSGDISAIRQKAEEEERGGGGEERSRTEGESDGSQSDSPLPSDTPQNDNTPAG